MKVFSILLLFAFDIAGKCDSYFVGNVHYRRRSHGYDQDETASIQGCKKGCFWNASYSEDGIPKCLKCKEIKDETECLMHSATCQWSRSGKCKSQSCPSMAKGRVTLFGQGGDVVNDNTTFESQYRDRVKKEKECVEGSPLEQKFNNLYLEDYKTTTNYKYAVWNVDDACLIPGSKVTGGGDAYGWESVKSGNAAANEAACKKYIGYTYVADQSSPVNNSLDQCVAPTCTMAPPTTQPSPAYYKQACENLKGCIYIRGSSQNGDGVQGDVCEPAGATSCTRNGAGGVRWEGGKNTSADCLKTEGCIYLRAANDDRRRDENGLHPDDECVPKCIPFTPGTSTRIDCETLGCTYRGSDVDDDRTGKDLRTFKDVDLCPAERLPPKAPGAPGIFCGRNSSLDLAQKIEDCDDRTFGSGGTCSVPQLTTEEACRSGYGTWNAGTPKFCRELFGMIRSRCEFLAKDDKRYVVNDGNLTSRKGGNKRPGTFYEWCVQTEFDNGNDTFKTETVVRYGGESDMVPAYLTPEDRENIYGYRTPEDYCGHQLELALQQCQRTYDNSVAGCHTQVVQFQVKADDWVRSAVEIKAMRSACHRLYGCMYSKSNERCSVWAVWAFILAIILSVVAVSALLVVLVVVILPILKKSSA